MDLNLSKKSCLVFLVFLFAVAVPGYAKKKWYVDPVMSRNEIQSVIALAEEGDTIIFRAGIYDFSDTPMSGLYDPAGALEVVEKSLTLKGEPGNLIIGRPSENPTSIEARGVKGIYIRNADCTKDVTIDGLNFKSFLRGIANFIMADPLDSWSFLPSGNDMEVKNCSFNDIHRNAIDFSLAKGNIIISNNQINTNRAGITISWRSDQFPDLMQPKKSHVKVFNNQVTSAVWNIWFEKATNVMVNENSFTNGAFGIGMSHAMGKIHIMKNRISNCIRGMFLEGNKQTSDVIFAGNTLTGIRYMGISIYGDFCFGNNINGNGIAMNPGSLAAIHSAAHDNNYEGNTISGSGSFACLLSSVNMASGVTSYPHHETFIDNSVAEFVPMSCHYLLDYGSYDNFIQGIASENANLMDLGEDNQISGLVECSSQLEN